MTKTERANLLRARLSTKSGLSRYVPTNDKGYRENLGVRAPMTEKPHNFALGVRLSPGKPIGKWLRTMQEKPVMVTPKRTSKGLVTMTRIARQTFDYYRLPWDDRPKADQSPITSTPRRKTNNALRVSREITV